MVSFRKSKKVGPFRVTASKSGLSVSGGVKGARVSVNSKGEARRTLSVPGTGIYDTKRIGGKGSGGAGTTEHEMQLQVINAARGTRTILSNTPGVTSARVVDVKSPIPEIAQWLNIGRNAEGWVRGIRDALLVPSGDEVAVLALVKVEDNPSAFSKRDKEKLPIGKNIGRLNKKSATALVSEVGSANVQCVIYVDATPGLDHQIEARWFTDDLSDNQPPPPMTAPAPPMMPPPPGTPAPPMMPPQRP